MIRIFRGQLLKEFWSYRFSRLSAVQVPGTAQEIKLALCVKCPLPTAITLIDPDSPLNECNRDVSSVCSKDASYALSVVLKIVESTKRHDQDTEWNCQDPGTSQWRFPIRCREEQ